MRNKVVCEVACVYIHVHAHIIVLAHMHYLLISRSSKKKAGTMEAPKKRRRLSEHKYLPEYTTEWPAIVRSKLDSFNAFCVLCKCDFSVGHAGRYDITKHINTVKHKSYQTAVESTKSVPGFFTPAQDTHVPALLTLKCYVSTSWWNIIYP